MNICEEAGKFKEKIKGLIFKVPQRVCIGCVIENESSKKINIPVGRILTIEVKNQRVPLCQMCRKELNMTYSTERYKEKIESLGKKYWNLKHGLG